MKKKDLELQNKKKELEMEEELKRIQKEQEEIVKSKQEMEAKEAQKLQEIQLQLNKKEKDKKRIESKVAKQIPKIDEVNLICKELKRNIIFSIKLDCEYYDEGEEKQDENSKRIKIRILVENKEEGEVYKWTRKKFFNRYFMIKELLDEYLQTDEIPKLDKKNDPFWDPPEAQLIGKGYLKLLSLAYQLDNPTTIKLIGDDGERGRLKVNIIPTDESGRKNLSEEAELTGEFIDDPQEILGKRLDFKVVIENGNLPDNFCKHSYVEYELYNEQHEKLKFQTNTVSGHEPNPFYNYSRQHTYLCVNQEIIDYLTEKNLSFGVWGYRDLISESVPVDDKIQHGNREKSEALTNTKEYIQAKKESIQKIKIHAASETNVSEYNPNFNSEQKQAQMNRDLKGDDKKKKKKDGECSKIIYQGIF